MNNALLRVWSISPEGYPEITPAAGISQIGEFIWLPTVDLGLTLWAGQFEDEVTRIWLRWCDRNGQVIPTGAERADRLAERLRQLGVNPDEI
jgi:hypothetical protein